MAELGHVNLIIITLLSMVGSGVCLIIVILMRRKTAGLFCLDSNFFLRTELNSPTHFSFGGSILMIKEADISVTV